MKNIGFPISHKEHEYRRALVPMHISSIKHPEHIFIETGYGDVLGFSDEDYRKQGVNICSHEDALKQDIICDPKIGDADFLAQLNDQTIFGWVHAVQNRDITDKLLQGKLTVYAWEDMFENGKHSFWRNNEIAGESAVSHAFLCHGIFPYETKIAVLGCGNVGRGACKALKNCGADVTVYDKDDEERFRKEFIQYDVIINAILWDTTRHDHIINRADLKRMKKGAMIVDISCDKAGAIETSIPTTIDNPTYVVDGVTHYVVDHTPSLYFKSTSLFLSSVVAPLCDELITDQPSEVLQKAKCIDKGKILDQRIIDFQHR